MNSSGGANLVAQVALKTFKRKVRCVVFEVRWSPLPLTLTASFVRNPSGVVYVRLKIGRCLMDSHPVLTGRLRTIARCVVSFF